MVKGRQTSGRSHKDERRRIIVKTAMMLMIGACLLVLAALGWFALNKTVTGNGMNLQMKGSSFEIEVRGSNIENQAVITDSNLFDEGFTNGVRQTNSLGESVDAYRTDSSNDKIYWRTDSAGTYPDGLEPGSHGELTFYVIPSSTGVLNLSFDFDVRGYHACYDENDDLSELIEITSSLTDNPSKGITSAQNKKKALGYLNSHLMFFKDYDSSTGYYSGFCGQDTIEFNDFITGNDKTVVEGRAYEVTVYWIWVTDVIDLVMDSNSEYSGDQMFADNNSDDREAVFEYMGDTTNTPFFDGISAADIATHLGNLQDNDSTNDYNSLRILTERYDDADLLIGNNVNYILIEMTTEEG